MYFCGKYSKFTEGDRVIFGNAVYTVKSIGILGSKLSPHVFLYHIKSDDGKTFDVIEDALKVLSNEL